jgi:myo-inositol-1(or 4)-monophosphatase
VTDKKTESGIDLDFLKSCLVDAGNLALEQRGRVSAEIKEDLTPVTIVDRQVEDFLIRRIQSRYPADRILSEESGLHPGSGTTWVIDPIDGTRAFAAGLPVWGVSIGLLRDNQPAAGGLYIPVTRDLYLGTGRQAFYNDTLLDLPQPIDPDSSLAFLAVPSDFHLAFTTTYPRIRSMGSTAAHLAYTAVGAAAGALLHHYSLWDIAGMLPFLSAMDIKITTLSGQIYSISELLSGKKGSQPVLAARGSVHDQIRAAIHALSPAGL